MHIQLLFCSQVRGRNYLHFSVAARSARIFLPFFSCFRLERCHFRSLNSPHFVREKKKYQFTQERQNQVRNQGREMYFHVWHSPLAAMRSEPSEQILLRDEHVPWMCFFYQQQPFLCLLPLPSSSTHRVKCQHKQIALDTVMKVDKDSKLHIYLLCLFLHRGGK